MESGPVCGRRQGLFTQQAMKKSLEGQKPEEAFIKALMEIPMNGLGNRPVEYSGSFLNCHWHLAERTACKRYGRGF
jgi:hypothetical protein